MKYFLSILLLTFIPIKTFAEYAGTPSGCGIYEISGKIEKNVTEVGYSLVVNSKTMSEYKLLIPLSLESLIIGYNNKQVKIKATLKSENQNVMEIDKLDKIEPRFPNPLNPKQNNGFKIISINKCSQVKNIDL